MVQSADAPVSLVLPRRPRSSRGRLAAPVGYNDAGVLPKTVGGHRAPEAVSMLPPRSVRPAEVAQARVFEGLLQTESAELHELAHRMAGVRDQAPDSDSSAPAWDLMQIRARIDEIQHLLQALRGRFPHPSPESDR